MLHAGLNRYKVLEVSTKWVENRECYFLEESVGILLRENFEIWRLGNPILCVFRRTFCLSKYVLDLRHVSAFSGKKAEWNTSEFVVNLLAPRRGSSPLHTCFPAGTLVSKSKTKANIKINHFNCQVKAILYHAVPHHNPMVVINSHLANAILHFYTPFVFQGE